jgi:hypothetical protein
MFECIGFATGGFLLGLVAAKLWHKYMDEDMALVRAEAVNLCDRLDKVITEVRQAAAVVKVVKS